MMNCDDSHSILEGLYTRFRSAAENCIPKYKRRRFHSKPWWSSECKASWREREKCYRKFKRTNNTEDKINWKRARALTMHTFREAKQKSWREYVSTLNAYTP